MKKFNKLVSAAVATAMVMGATAVPAMAGDFVPTEDGTYVADMVEAYNYYTPSQYSMCNGVFAGEADVTVDGEWATLHLYVCNPTPSWSGLETGILSNAYITVDGVEYTGELTSIGTIDEAINPDAAVKLFTQDSSFFGIVNGTSYACDTMEFTIPTAALASNIEISAFVNLVMNSQQSFWLDINWLEGDVAAPEVTEQTMNITATVPANVATYEVTIPANVTMPELSKTEETTLEYTVEVDTEYLDKTISVATEESVTLTNDDETASLTLTNDFGTEGTATFAEDGSEKGILKAAADDVAKLAGDDAVTLSGSITFTITAE